MIDVSTPTTHFCGWNIKFHSSTIHFSIAWTISSQCTGISPSVKVLEIYTIFILFWCRQLFATIPCYHFAVSIVLWNEFSFIFSLLFSCQSCWTCSRCRWQLWVTESMRAYTSSLTITPSRHRSSTHSIIPTLMSSWGRQLAPEKLLQQRWLCSGSSTSIQPLRLDYLVPTVKPYWRRCLWKECTDLLLFSLLDSFDIECGVHKN